MSTEETKRAVEELELSTAHAEKYGWPKVQVDREEGRAILNYVKELEAQVEKSTVKFGDTVEITSRGQFVGMSGKVINIEPFADTYPYSVEFVNSDGQRLAVGYFSREDLKKI